jgi:hypothetical protein
MEQRRAKGRVDGRSETHHPPAEGTPSVRPRRRDFLAVSAMMVAGSLFERAAAAMEIAGETAETANAKASASAEAASAPAETASVGYLEGSDNLVNLRRLSADLRLPLAVVRANRIAAERHVVPAASLGSGDASLAGAALRMTVHGFYPPLYADAYLRSAAAVAAAALPRAVDVDVIVPCPELGSGGARYEAWSYRRLPAEDRSARVSFLVAPDWYSDLGVEVRVVPAGAAKAHLLRTTFTLGRVGSRPRLQRGAYLLGLAAGAWDRDADLPEQAEEVPPDLRSVLITLEPEGVRLGGRAR